MLKQQPTTILEFKNVSFGYEPKTTILSNISFSLNEKEHICIIGANGCGKSTLVKLVVGLFKPRSGSIYFKSKLVDKNNVNDLKKACGIIFENPDNQFIGLSVQDDIAFGLENKCVPREKMQPIIDKVAKYTGITEYLKSSTKDLSGGQKQLVALSSILALNPQIIVFDEVTCMLDSKSKNKVNNILSSLKTNQNKTIITITHDMDEAAKADRVIVMNGGKIVMVGKPQQIFSSSKLNSLSIDKPFVWKLANRFNSKNLNLDQVVKDINNEK